MGQPNLEGFLFSCKVQGSPSGFYTGNGIILYTVLRGVIDKIRRYLLNNTYNTFISGVKSSWTNLYTNFEKQWDLNKKLHTDLRGDGDGTVFFAHQDDARLVNAVVFALRADLAAERDWSARLGRNRHSHVLSGEAGSRGREKQRKFLTRFGVRFFVSHSTTLLPIFLKGFHLDWLYRVVQMDFTHEIEVFIMIFDRL